MLTPHRLARGRWAILAAALVTLSACSDTVPTGADIESPTEGASMPDALETAVDSQVRQAVALGPGTHPGAHGGSVAIEPAPGKPAGDRAVLILRFANYSSDGRLVLSGTVQYQPEADGGATIDGDLQVHIRIEVEPTSPADSGAADDSSAMEDSSAVPDSGAVHDTTLIVGNGLRVTIHIVGAELVDGRVRIDDGTGHGRGHRRGHDDKQGRGHGRERHSEDHADHHSGDADAEGWERCVAFAGISEDADDAVRARTLVVRQLVHAAALGSGEHAGEVSGTVTTTAARSVTAGEDGRVVSTQLEMVFDNYAQGALVYDGTLHARWEVGPDGMDKQFEGSLTITGRLQGEVRPCERLARVLTWTVLGGERDDDDAEVPPVGLRPATVDDGWRGSAALRAAMSSSP